MSIKDLEEKLNKTDGSGKYNIYLFPLFNGILDILKDLTQEQQNLYKELALLKKEDEINLLNIKIGGTD